MTPPSSRSLALRYLRRTRQDRLRNSFENLTLPPDVDRKGQPHQIFRLLDLPAELRNLIYAFAVTASRPIRIECHVSAPRRIKVKDREDAKHIGCKLPDLAATSRVLRHEVLPVFFRENTFVFYASDHVKVVRSRICRWLVDQVGEYSREIRHVGATTNAAVMGPEHRPQPLAVASIQLNGRVGFSRNTSERVILRCTCKLLALKAKLAVERVPHTERLVRAVVACSETVLRTYHLAYDID